MQNKPKVTGLSFDIFAIAGFLILLPIAIGLVTNLANTNSEEYISINTEYQEELYEDSICFDPNLGINDKLLLEWTDKGTNMTPAYHYVEQTTPGSDDYIYSSIWDDSDPKYERMIGGCPSQQVPLDDKLFLYGQDDHFYLPYQYNQGLIPNYHGYIGYSGTDFSFNVTNNLFKHLDDSKDLSSIKLSFVEIGTGYDCDNEIFKEVSFNGEITLIDSYSSKKYTGFSNSQINSYYVPFDPLYSQSSFCVIGIDAEFDFTPIESIEINDIFSDYDNLSASVRLYNFDIDNYTYTAPVGQFSPQIPFTGDDYFGMSFEVAYVDNVRTNFFLSGGTLVMGILLFLLAIANTQYWNPVINFFKPKEA